MTVVALYLGWFDTQYNLHTDVQRPPPDIQNQYRGYCLNLIGDTPPVLPWSCSSPFNVSITID